MTLLLSLLHQEAIIMAADSRLTTNSTPVDPASFQKIGPTSTKYQKANKLFEVPGIGCVTMWGDLTRVGQKVAQFLQYSKPSNIDDLAEQLLQFLKKEVDESSDDDVGFHVGGYRSDGKQALFHVFYGSDVGPEVDPDHNPQKFAKYDHSSFLALYNGKHEIAYTYINFLLSLEHEVGIVKWITQHPLEKAIHFADFILRYAAKLDPTIGDDIKIAVIKSENKIEILSNISRIEIVSNISDIESIRKADSPYSSPLPSGISAPNPESSGTASRG